MGAPRQLPVIQDEITALPFFQYPLFTELPQQPEHMAVAHPHGAGNVCQCIAKEAPVRILYQIGAKPLFAGA